MTRGMGRFCAHFAAALAAGWLGLAAAPGLAEEFDPELWLAGVEPQMTRHLTQGIERDTSASLAPWVVRRLRAATRPGIAQAVARQTLPAQAGPPAVRASMSCRARTASAFDCVVHPAVPAAIRPY